MKIKLDEVIWDEALYPRTHVDWKTSYEYADAMKAGAVFPPIEVAKVQDGYLGLDGRHRWTAAKRLKLIDIEATVVSASTAEQRYTHAVTRNIQHGRRLSTFEKIQIAQKMREDFGAPITKIAGLLAMPKKSLTGLLSRRLSAPITSLVSSSSGLQEPLKAPLEHLAGTNVQAGALSAQRMLAARDQVALLEQVCELMEMGALDVPTTIEQLQRMFVWLCDNQEKFSN